MSIRGLVIGILGGILIASCGYINDNILLLERFTGGSQLPIIVMGLLFLVLLVVNPLLLTFYRKYRFTGSELALIVALWCASCSIPARGLLEQLTHGMVLPYYWELQAPSWRQSHLLDYAGSKTLVTLPDRKLHREEHMEAYDNVVNGYIRGNTDGLSGESLTSRIGQAIGRVPWSAWRTPLMTWVPLVLLSALASVCLALITYRQWAYHEILSYPIANFMNQLIIREEHRILPAIMHNPLFWIGFAVLLLIRVNNGLAVWYPDFCIPVTLDFNMLAFGKLWPNLSKVDWGTSLLYVRVFPLVIAFAFFLSSEISLTIGISNIVWVLVAMPMVTMGWDLNTNWVGGWQGWERAGAYLAMFVILVYTGRHYYGKLLLRAMGYGKSGNKDEKVNVLAFRLLLASVVFMIILVCRLGLEWPFALITVFLMLMTFVVVARISAETGLFFIQPRWTIFGLLSAGFGSFFFSPSNHVICGLVCVMLCLDQCNALLPYVTNGLKLCDRQKVKTHVVGTAIFWMYAIGVLCAIGVLLVAVYEWGAPLHNSWSYFRVPTMVFRNAQTSIQQLMSVGSLEAAETLSWTERLARIAPEKHFVFAFCFGLFSVWLFSFLRLRFTWWPLHPVLFLLWATYPIEQTCHGFLIGWLLKVLCVRFGGSSLVKKVQPLMVGIISGELFAAMVFMVSGGIYYSVTGEIPKSCRWFPH